MPVESRLAASRLRLLAHSSLETAPEPVLPATRQFEPRLLVRLLSQLDERDTSALHGLNPVALADREVLSQISCAASLSDERWRATISKGCTTTNLNRDALKSIAKDPFQTSCFAPAANLVDDAMTSAMKVHKSLATARQKLRTALRENERAEAARKLVVTFPKEWSNLGPRSEIPTSKPDQNNENTTTEQVAGETTTKNKRNLRNSTVNKGAKCCFCPEGETRPLPDGDESELLGPFVNSRGRATLYVHFDCACWAPQVFADPKTSQFRSVYDEYRRGRQLRCTGCRGKGATVGCYIEKCKRVFHFRCLEDAGAKKVTQFFAAFCKTHAHLAEKDTYKLMMRAHTIADVAAARRESTDGLDAPHSKYTKLRRRDTEIIFSRSAGICSHAGVYEHGKTLFSSARRAVMSNNERLRIDDRVRVVRHSAIAVASGYLALLAAGRTQDDEDEDVNATEARAAIASKSTSPLFLLRNLEGAPEWTSDDIAIAKPARRRSVHFNQRMRKYARHMLPGVGSNEEATKTSTRKRHVEEESEEEVNPVGRTRSSSVKTRRLNDGTSTRESAPLPTNHRLSGTRFLKATGPVQSENEDDVSDAAPSPIPSPPKKQSGWDVFLAEQLPRERAVRPEDDMDVALSNMARMWSLLPASDRTGYENRASSSTIITPAPGNSAASLPDAPRRPRPENRAAGLFSVRTPSSTAGPSNTRTTSRDAAGSKTQSESSKGRGSVAIPSSQRRRWRSSPEETPAPMHDTDPNWDDMFPTDLT